MIIELKKFGVRIKDKEIVKDIDLSVKKGETIVIMGPNGSGKSTLAMGLMGHPNLMTSGEVLVDGRNILEMQPDERSKAGLFLSFQYPQEISGVTVSNFLRTALNSRHEKTHKIKLLDFMKILHEQMQLLHIPKEFATRYLNEGFSGGEKKKMEILQLAILQPKIAILDETDSGLDIDALKAVCEGINILKQKNPDLTLIVITHYQRILNYLKPDRVCMMVDGRIIREGGHELVMEIEEKGYEVRNA
jgi:Fe-S cluster assembly ATP-binding protein